MERIHFTLLPSLARYGQGAYHQSLQVLSQSYFSIFKVKASIKTYNYERVLHGRDPDRGDEEATDKILFELCAEQGVDRPPSIDIARLCTVAKSVSILTCSVLGSFLSQVLFF